MPAEGPTDAELAEIEALGIEGLGALDAAYEKLSHPEPIPAIVAFSGRRIAPKPTLDDYDLD